MGAIEASVSYWNSAVSPQQMEFCVSGGDWPNQLISESWKAGADREK